MDCVRILNWSIRRNSEVEYRTVLQRQISYAQPKMQTREKARLARRVMIAADDVSPREVLRCCSRCDPAGRGSKVSQGKHRGEDQINGREAERQR